MKNKILLLICFVFSFEAFSQGGTTEFGGKKQPFSLSGYVDAYYFYNFNGINTNLGASGFERIFDQKANSFQLGMVQLKGSYVTEKVEGVFDLTFGNHADLANYGNSFSPLGNEFGSTGLAIKQAYIAWNVTNKLKLTAGQYGTNIGYEVIDAPLNFNYSLSNLFGNGPFYHTGIKADYSVSDRVGLMFGITNGLDSKDDFNSKKGYQGQIFLNPAKDWNLYLNYFGSDEGSDEEKDYMQWFDISTTYAAGSRLSLGLNATYGKSETGEWVGTAIYANEKFSELFSLGARFEYFNNSDGAIYLVDSEGNGVSTTGITLTGNFTITPNLMVKPEFRFDSYSHSGNAEVSQLTNKDGLLTKDSQATFGAAMIFHF